MMSYLLSVLLLMFVLPALSVVADIMMSSGEIDVVTSVMAPIGKWFTFWAVGVRLFMAGLMQIFRPQFTAQSIFELQDPAGFAIVREVGFGNLAIGLLGLASLAMPDWVIPAAFAASLYYGLAGAGHLVRQERNAKEQIALFSDLGIFLLLAVFVMWRLG